MRHLSLAGSVDSRVRLSQCTFAEGRRFLSVVVCGLLLSLVTSLARADDYYWDNDGTGFPFYSSPSWWSLDPAFTTPAGTAPGSGDDVLFTINDTYSVILGTNDANSVTLSDGDVTFDGASNGGTLTSNGTGAIDDASATMLSDGAIMSLVSQAVWHNDSGQLLIGDTAFGTLNVQSGSVVTSPDIRIGHQSGSNGEVTVDGTGGGAMFGDTASPDALRVGDAGTGTLTISNNGDVRSAGTLIGDIDGSMGTVNVMGAGSTFHTAFPGGTATSYRLSIGNAGTGQVNITAGGSMMVTDDKDTFLGEQATGDGTLFIDNGGFTASDTTAIGSLGAGTVTVQNGGTFYGQRTVSLADQPGSQGTVTVDNATFTVGAISQTLDDLTIGNNDLGTFTVRNNGELNVEDDTFIGNSAAADGDNKLMVETGATATLDDVTYVGNAGKGTIEVKTGGTVTTGFLRVGQQAGSEGHITIDGASSQVDALTNEAAATGDTVIGTGGTGTLLITAGGRLNTNTLYVGYDNNGDGTITVDGADSLLVPSSDNSGDVFIGGYTGGNGGTGLVTIQNGGQLFDPNALTVDEMFLGGNSNGDGTLTVTGPTSAVNGSDGLLNETLTVGYTGRGVLNIEDGGTVRYELVRVGESSSSTEATINVSGVNTDGTPKPSQLNVDGGLIVGVGRPATMTVSGGATVDSNTNDDGAQVATIGLGAFSETTTAAPTVTVTGDGSRWTHHDAALIVAGSGGTSAHRVLLEILDSGEVQAEQVIIGQLDNNSTGGDDRSFGRVHVSGTGSNLLVQDVGASTFGNLRVGDVGDGLLDVDSGGVVTAGLVEIGNATDSDGQVNVDGAGSLLEGTGFSVGDDIVAVGIVNITDGGTVRSTGVMNLGEQSSSSNGVVIVGTFEGGDDIATVDVAGNLNVGGNDSANAGHGTLAVRTTGMATIGGTLRIYEDGTVNLDGGTIEAADLALVSGGSPQPDFNFNSGTFRYTGNKTIVAQTLTDLIGGSTLTGNREIAVAGTATLNTPLRLNDVNSKFSVGSISAANLAANFDFDAGTFNLTSANLTVGAGGLFGSSLVIDANQAIHVTNQATVDAGAELVAAGGFSSGGLTNNGDLVAVDTTIGGPVVNNSNITVVGTVDFDGPVSGSGGFFGPGTVNFSGGMAPGASPAEVAFEGSVALAETNSLFIEIGGTTLGDDYDSLTIAGDATLDGNLDVSLINDFTPTSGQQFTVLTASNIVDHGLVLGGSAASLFSLIVDSTSVILQGVVPGLTGDYNGDGTVDAADYALWRSDPSSYGGAQGYTDWVNNFGQTSGGGSLASVPEPSSLILFAIAFVLVGRCVGSSRRPKR